jgi:phosphatidylinositol glycan class Q protein
LTDMWSQEDPWANCHYFQCTATINTLSLTLLFKLWQCCDFFRFFVIIGHLFCKFLASFSTVFYIVLQFFQTYFNHESESWLYLTSVNVFKKTAWINIRIRCCQILYWPILLQENDLR